METRRVWIIEEVKLNDGSISHRQSMVEIHDDPSTGDWAWKRPDNRIDPSQQTEWDRVINILSNIGGEDLRHVICGQGLMDHCSGHQDITKYNPPV